MGVINTISNFVKESKDVSRKGVPEKELYRLEKNYYESLKIWVNINPPLV